MTGDDRVGVGTAPGPLSSTEGNRGTASRHTVSYQISKAHDALSFSLTVVADEHWRAQAACPGNARLFDVDGSKDLNGERQMTVRRICDRCPVSGPCATWAQADRWTGYAAGRAWVGGQPHAQIPYVAGKSTDLIFLEARSTSAPVRLPGATMTPKTTDPLLPTAHPGECRCGCGQPVRKLFVQGHDARLAGALIAAVRSGETTPSRAVAAARKVSDGIAAKVARSVQR